MQKELFQWYLKNQTELVSKYNGKYLVITNSSVGGSFDNEDDAINFAVKNFGLGNFIVQKCSPGNSDYTQMYHSRAIFA